MAEKSVNLIEFWWTPFDDSPVKINQEIIFFISCWVTSYNVQVFSTKIKVVRDLNFETNHYWLMLCLVPIHDKRDGIILDQSVLKSLHGVRIWTDDNYPFSSQAFFVKSFILCQNVDLWNCWCYLTIKMNLENIFFKW